MAAFGFVLHPENPKAGELAQDLASWLEDRSHEVRFRAADAQKLGLTGFGEKESDFAIGLDLVVCLGGDGTMLAAVQLAAAEGVPVLGVNLGQLGYLVPVEPLQARVALKRFLAGDVQYEDRMRVGVDIIRQGETVAHATGLNEVMLENAECGHTVRIAVTIDGDDFTTYVADGMIVASPTGSTAYAFSARGPILDPRYRALVVVPVAPHMLFDRALVLDPSAEVVLTVAGDRVAHAAVDGVSYGELHPGDQLRCTAAPAARLARIGSMTFHDVLIRKFGLAHR